MTPTASIRRIALLAVLLLLAAACGQKEGVHVSAGGGSGGGGDLGSSGFSAGGEIDPETGQPLDPAAGGGIDPETGQPIDPAAGGQVDPATGQPVGPSGGGGGGGGGRGGGQAPRGAGGGGQAEASVGDTIVFGVHAPITGAAPLPATFADGAKIYPDYINSKGGIHGRQLKVIVVDDEYQPATASRKCTEMVQQGKAFLLIGGGGTDQIQACARTAAQLGVPYLSAGVTERGLRGLPNYFAVSMSYAQQGPYLAKFMKQTFPDRVDKVAMVYSGTPNFQDARDAFMGAMGGAKEYKLSREPSQSELAQTAQRMCGDGTKIAYPLMAPASWLFLAGQANSIPGCDIQWSGVGLTMGLNTVASTGCRANNAIEGATFFSPFPGVDKALQMDPEFAEAVKGKSWDDIAVALWASTKAIAKLTEAVGPGLNPATFVQKTEQTRNLQTGMNPVLSFSPDDHFGARQVHVLKADCGKREYVTMASFATF